MRLNSNLLLTATSLLLALSSPAFAGTAQGTFAIQISLSNPAYAPPAAPYGYCTNQTLSQGANATVTVVCGSNQFVSITPRSGGYFAGVNGSAYRFLLESRTQISQDDPLWYIGAGTITTLHILQIKGQQEVMEMLVSF